MRSFRSLIDFSLSPRILTLASPVVVAMITQTLINQVDHILVGHLPEAESVPGQTALQYSQIFLWMFGGFLSAIAVGTQALVARRVGESNPLAAGAVSSNSLILALVSSVIVTGFCYWLTPYLFALASSRSVRDLGIPFLRYRFLNITAMVLAASYKSFFDALGKTRVYMTAAISGNIINLILCVAFIFGTTNPNIAGINQIHKFLMYITGGHLPRLGIKGAGLASLISSYVLLAVIMSWSFRSRYRKYRIYHFSNLSMKSITQIARLSIPSGLATWFAMIGFAFAIWVAGRLDFMQHWAKGETIYTTATSNMISIMMLVFITCIGYGTAVATLVSQSLGAKKQDLAEKYVYTAGCLGLILFSVVGLAISIWAKEILHFWNPAEKVVQAATPILRVLGIFQPLILIALLFTYALNGAGNTRFVMIVELILHFVCLMPLCYILGIVLHLGIWGVWMAMMVYIFAVAAVMSIKFNRNTWKHIQI